MKKLLPILMVAAGISQGQIQTINSTDPVSTGPSKINSNFNFLMQSKVAIWSGAGTPGTINLSVLGDLYINTAVSPRVTYQCYAVTMCSGVSTGQWQLIGAGSAQVYPPAGIPLSTGSAWGASYSTGTSPGNLVLLNSSAQLPAVSAALLTNFPTLNQNTTGTAENVTGVVQVAHGGTGTTTPGIVAGTNVTITGSWPNQTVNASGNSGFGSVPANAATGSGGTRTYTFGNPVNTIYDTITGATTITVGGVSTGSGPYYAYIVNQASAGANLNPITWMGVTIVGFCAIDNSTTNAVTQIYFNYIPAVGAVILGCQSVTDPGVAANNLEMSQGTRGPPIAATAAAVNTALSGAPVTLATLATTATNLTSYPTLCGGGQFSQGLSSGSNNCGTPGGGSPLSTTLFWPFGQISYNVGTATPALGSANVVEYYEFYLPSPGVVLNNISAYITSGATANHGAFAIYDSACTTLLGTTNTVAATSAVAVNFPFASPVSLAGGKYFLAMTSDQSTLKFDGPPTSFVSDVANLNESASTYHTFTGNASTGTSTLAFNAACGTRTALSVTGGVGAYPGVALH
jgi:hypothetical protein